MDTVARLNEPFLYIVCGSIIAFIFCVALFMCIRAYRAGIAMGLDCEKLRRAVVSSVTFSVLPSVGIFLGVIALSGALGIPWPWLRLSVIGALHYETQMADAAASAVGMSGLVASEMTPKAFVTIALVMGVCIAWEPLLCAIHCKRYSNRLANRPIRLDKSNDSGNNMVVAMFIGLISAYVASYFGQAVHGTWKPLAVSGVAMIVMFICIQLRKRFNMEWIDGFSVAGSMLVSMAVSLLI